MVKGTRDALFYIYGDRGTYEEGTVMDGRGIRSLMDRKGVVRRDIISGLFLDYSNVAI